MISIDSYLKENLKPDRLRHTYAVRDLGIRLAKKHGADVEKVSVACLFHDIAKGRKFTAEVMNEYVREFGLDEKYIDNRALAHSRVAAELMQREWNITDEEILNAVRYHTVGRPGMSLIEKIVFIADATEEGRHYPGVEKLRDLAFNDLDAALYHQMNDTIMFVAKSGRYLDVESVCARNYYMKRRK